MNAENVVWFVSDHERRIAHVEERLEDILLVKSNVERCNKGVHDLRSDVAAVRDLLVLKASTASIGDLEHAVNEKASKEDVDSLRRALYTFALSVTASAVIFAITLLAVYR